MTDWRNQEDVQTLQVAGLYFLIRRSCRQFICTCADLPVPVTTDQFHFLRTPHLYATFYQHSSRSSSRRWFLSAEFFKSFLV
ncbi:hypothetical protein CHARACLAT_030407 [Characodon lateralis]|uniref:Uncharacterized protein n=1 Tax=Characodon lateralis TaxID=208331 RepID=A0ABU7CUV1_9TELE|nr:hypothetical protein [Characodon lateralis]